MSRRARSASASVIRRPEPTAAVLASRPVCKSRVLDIDRRGSLADRHLHNFRLGHLSYPARHPLCQSRAGDVEDAATERDGDGGQRVRRQEPARCGQHRVVGMDQCPGGVPAKRSLTITERCSGTNTSRRTCDLLPVPRRPSTNRRRSRPRRAAPADRQSSAGRPSRRERYR